MENFFNDIFKDLSEDERREMREKARKDSDARHARKEKSFWQCRIPDWTGSGGMVEFWYNDDTHTFEADDSRFDDSNIREGIRELAEW